MAVVKILSKVIDLVTLGIVIVCIGLLLPMIFKIKPYVVMSGSMEPQISTGSVAYIDTKFDGSEAEIGDIVAFESGEIFITHRVIDINSDNELITKGDANTSEDIAPISRDKVIGKTVFSIPYVGFVIERIKGKMLIYIAALILLLNIMMNMLVSGFEEEKKTKPLAIEDEQKRKKEETTGSIS